MRGDDIWADDAGVQESIRAHSASLPRRDEHPLSQVEPRGPASRGVATVGRPCGGNGVGATRGITSSNRLVPTIAAIAVSAKTGCGGCFRERKSGRRIELASPDSRTPHDLNWDIAQNCLRWCAYGT
jgi:hypothetical protein